MTCSNKGCKTKTNINPKSRLCPSCDDFFRGVRKRLESSDRQQQARDSEVNSRRHLDDSERDEEPLEQNQSAHSEKTLPQVDINSILKSCEEARSGVQVDTGKALQDILGMVVHIYSKQSENDEIKAKVESNTARIDELEAKIGDRSEVAFPRSISIRKLPLPPIGVTELQNVKHYLKEIHAPGVRYDNDVVKVIRKQAANHDPSSGPNLGTVLVELRNEEIRRLVMINKKNLERHPSITLRNLIIKNALTPSELKSHNT